MVEALCTPSGSALADKSSLEPRHSIQQANSQEARQLFVSFFLPPSLLPPSVLLALKHRGTEREETANFLASVGSLPRMPPPGPAVAGPGQAREPAACSRSPTRAQGPQCHRGTAAQRHQPLNHPLLLSQVDRQGAGPQGKQPGFETAPIQPICLAG